MRAIVFFVRGCPAGWLGAYGNEWVGTPNLDRLAAESVVFDRHISECPDPAGASRAFLGAGALADGRTVLVRANHPDTDAPASFYDSWGEVFDARPQDADASPLDNLIRTLPSVLDRLAEVPRWLLWIDIDRLVPPWDVPQEVFEAYITDEDEDGDGEGRVAPWADPPTGPFDKSDLAAWQWLHSSFAAVVTTLDAELGSVFDELRRRGLDQTAAWFVTSDFGYPLGEHGQIGVHRPWLYEELVHVPLILRLPGAAEAGRRVPAFTQPADIEATLASLFGENRSGNLLPLARGEATALRPHALTLLEINGAEECAIRTEEFAFLLPLNDEGRPPMLFVKPDDRWEVNDVLSQHAEVAEQLKHEANEWLQQRRGSGG
jgi:arylsulfatase A-like enzyme